MLIEDLKNIDIFKQLSEKELEKISQITTVKTYKKDSILFFEGESPDFFYALLNGSVKVYKTGAKNNEVVLHYFMQPTLIAEMASLENIKFPATSCITKDDTKIALINKEAFIKLLNEDNTFSFHIIKSLTKKIKTLEVAINRNLIFDASSKVCSFIFENPTFLTTHKNIELASILNMAPETLSRVVTKLKKLNILDKQNNLIDKEKLETLIEF